MNTNPFEGQEAMQAGAFIFIRVASAWAYVVEVFLRRGFGFRYMDGNAFWGLCVLLGFSLCWEGHNLEPLAWMAGLYLVLNAVHRMNSGWQSWRGELIHSHYTGWPMLKWLAPRMTEAQFKLWVESVLVMFAGALLCAVNPPLGVFVLLGGSFVFFKNKNDRDRDRMRVIAINDSMIESRLALERFRGRAGFAS